MKSNIIKRILKNILNKVLSDKYGYANLKVRKGLAKGVILNLDLRIEASYWLGIYDKWIFDAVPLTTIIKEGMVVWDCGTYIGYYTAVFRSLVGSTGKVIGFEAASNTWERVSKLPLLNNWRNVEIHNLAVGPDHTTIKFVTNLGGSNGPLNLGKQYKESESEIKYQEVACCGIDELIYEKGIPAPEFIKFDLESGEEYALHNGNRFFLEKRPFILVELHGEREKNAAGLFLERYNYAGFLMEHVRSGQSPLCSKNDFDKIKGVPHMIYCVPR